MPIAPTEDRFPSRRSGIVHDVRQVIPSDGIVCLDNGMYKIWFARNYRTYVANTLLLDNALATMGAGLPSAMMAKLLYPERRVLAVCGDGGFMMNSQELETAVRLGLDLVVLILDDSSYGMIRWKQAVDGFPDFGLTFGNPDFVKYAESYGAQGWRVNATEDLIPTLEQAFSAGGRASGGGSDRLLREHARAHRGAQEPRAASLSQREPRRSACCRSCKRSTERPSLRSRPTMRLRSRRSWRPPRGPSAIGMAGRSRTSVSLCCGGSPASWSTDAITLPSRSRARAASRSADALVEVGRAIDGVLNAAEELRTFAGQEIPMGLTPASTDRWAFTTKEPIGVVAAISAFNHPLNLIVHQVVPAIAVGCPVIVKPASATPLSCLDFVALVHEAGLPEPWCQTFIPDRQRSRRATCDRSAGRVS